MRVDDVLRNAPRVDLTLVAGPWDARVVERVGLIADPGQVADARRGELALLTRGASRSAARRLVDLLELAGERELAALALYGRATTSPAAIAAASSARVALLAIGVGEDPALLAHALEAVLRSGPDAVLRRFVATLAAIDHAAPGGVEAVLIAASAELDAQISYRDGRVSADRDDTAVRIGCRLVADAIARAPATSEPVTEGGGDVILVGPADGEEVDLVMIEALRVASEAGWRARRAGAAVELSGEGDAVAVATRLIARVAAPVVCGIGRDGAEARAAVARAHATGVLGVPLRFDAADPRRLVLEVAGSATARSSAAGLLAPLERLGPRRADTAIETLRVYLDCWGSLARSGQILHLHPNAVAHRMKRVRALLPADLDDPDQRLALQIACRTRRPAVGRSELSPQPQRSSRAR